jgi:MFS superfamily sulfate permease-like transporter
VNVWCCRFVDRRKFSRIEYGLWLAGTARSAIAVVVALSVARIVAATDAGDEVFKLIRDIPPGIPEPQNPLSSVSADDMNEVLTASVTISLLGYLQVIAIGKSFAQKNG